MTVPPSLKPAHPFFGSGPCRKFPGWEAPLLKAALVSRSHRSPQGQGRIQEVMGLVRAVLDIPPTHQILILVGSATAAMEAAVWNLLGPKSVTALVHDVFSDRWAQDLTDQLKLPHLDLRRAPIGELPDLTHIPPDHDILVNWNGSTSGVAIPDGGWIEPDREGLVLCDATSAAYCMPLPWDKLDATAFSWQKGLGGEAGHGVLVLSPRAIDRLNRYRPTWPIPYLLNLTRHGQFLTELTEGLLINTPSLLCLEDYRQALTWALDIGGAAALYQRCRTNLAHIQNWLAEEPRVRFLCQHPAHQSTSTVCLTLDAEQPMTPAQRWHQVSAIAQSLEQRGIAYDIKNHAASAPSLRIWTGPTIDGDDVALLCAWLHYLLQTTTP